MRRRRRCSACDKRFTTYERAEIQLPQVVKKNGPRTEFDRDKLRGQPAAGAAQAAGHRRGGRCRHRPHRRKAAHPGRA